MYFVRIIDNDGFVIGEDVVEELTPNTIEAVCPEGFYKPKWNGTKYVEGLTQEEIEEIKNIVSEPTEEEKLEQLATQLYEQQKQIELSQEALDFMIMGGM